MCASEEDDQRYAGLDDKKRKRMISNRESARRSRMKKQRLLQGLTEQLGRLEAENRAIAVRIDDMCEKYAAVAAQNNVLRARERELAERLECLNDVIENSIGLDDTVDVIDDPLLKKHWGVLSPLLPIPASSAMFNL